MSSFLILTVDPSFQSGVLEIKYNKKKKILVSTILLFSCSGDPKIIGIEVESFEHVRWWSSAASLSPFSAKRPVIAHWKPNLFVINLLVTRDDLL